MLSNFAHKTFPQEAKSWKFKAKKSQIFHILETKPIHIFCDNKITDNPMLENIKHSISTAAKQFIC